MTNRRDEPRNEFLRRSLWRIRTTPGRRALAVGITFAVLVALGAGVMILVMAGLGRLDAPGWVVALPWIAPTVGMSVWALARPTPAILSDDDDDSWVGYVIRLVMVGSEQPRQRAARVITGVLFGAPVGWAFAVFVLVELTGIF
jgi:hypothetical protein